MWIGGIGAGWTTWTRESVIPDTLVLVVEPVELDGMTAIEEDS